MTQTVVVHPSADGVPDPGAEATAGEGRSVDRPVDRLVTQAAAPAERSQDDTDLGWGDDPAVRDDEWYLRERPPHHDA